MSNSDDVKPSAPPTLFGNEPDADATAQTRILASLEGRVPMAANAPARKPVWRYLGAGLVAVAATAVAGWLWLDPGADAPVSIQAGNPAVPTQPAAGAAAPGGQALADNVSASAPVTSAAPAESAQSVAENSQPQAATIVDAENSNPALDRLGKVDGAVVAAGAVAGVTTLAALTSPGTQPAGTGLKPAEVNKNPKKTATSKTTTPVEQGTASTAATSKDKKTVARANTSAKSKTTRRKSSATTADPDAEVLAALLSQPEGKPISTATASTRSAAKARN
ncbi:hypothetical protein VSR17_22920 [Cupriavidus taiwanensis]|uniref:hypothetical protein n=1 Tax=Cupriavidus taiwanensis TaxID=164546 RepID=UPI000E109DD2|nr:hypothetical protein [Cupriavidus taiwanensis]SOY61431.1 conserved hypothetical protein [Cupriavidus taiwanensis]SOY73941.1 conserved hypothetical protein [Cupriavidus taiwanensis]SOY97926.1 conserved hypothetical protein [Cupriavidus taiwanensis]SOZ31440.1 conserved hypothetical protein [Cupriavidus taiwanensis]SOZ67756.1 conserved hypothetical protein [Cupriavidus taiwanensis]